jgi:hypothetical protein
MKQSVSELHAAYPYDQDERWWPYDYATSFEVATAMADELHLQDDAFAYLEDLGQKDRDRAQAIGRSLLFLPPEVVLDQFGDRVGAWVVINTTSQGEGDDMQEALRTRAGYDTTDLEIAMNWNWRHGSHDHSATDVLAQYDLMQHVKNGGIKDIDLPEVLASSAREGIDLTLQRLGNYAIEPIETDDYNNYYSGGLVRGWSGDVAPTLAYSMWLDTPVGFALTYKGLPNAMVGLAMTGHDELMMYQLQGVQGRRIDPAISPYEPERVLGSVPSRGLAPLDWKKAMVGVTEQVAANMGLKLSAIQSAKNNVWTKKRMTRDTAPHLPMDKARQAYDDTAQRLGYEQVGTDKLRNWHKLLAD